MPDSRLRRTTLHTLASLLVLGLVAAGVIALWHPWGLWKISGVLPLLGMLALTVLASGPLLTALTYKPAATPRQRSGELAVLVLLQIAFLTLGLQGLYASRPVFVVAEGRQLVLVKANELSEDARAVADARFPAAWHSQPQLVAVPATPLAFGQASNLPWQPAAYRGWQTALPLLRLGQPENPHGLVELTLRSERAHTAIALDAQGQLQAIY